MPVLRSAAITPRYGLFKQSKTREIRVGEEEDIPLASLQRFRSQQESLPGGRTSIAAPIRADSRSTKLHLPDIGVRAFSRSVEDRVLPVNPIRVEKKAPNVRR